MSDPCDVTGQHSWSSTCQCGPCQNMTLSRATFMTSSAMARNSTDHHMGHVSWRVDGKWFVVTVSGTEVYRTTNPQWRDAAVGAIRVWQAGRRGDDLQVSDFVDGYIRHAAQWEGKPKPQGWDPTRSVEAQLAEAGPVGLNTSRLVDLDDRVGRIDNQTDAHMAAIRDLQQRVSELSKRVGENGVTAHTNSHILEKVADELDFLLGHEVGTRGCVLDVLRRWFLP